MHGTKNTRVIGLTGNIASGKSHIAEIFKNLGAVVQNSDIAAHQVMEVEAFNEVSRYFPQSIEHGKINRKLLGAEVFADDAKLKTLEEILHPLVRQKNLEFIKKNSDKIIVLEIPLLFENKAEEICDYVVFVHVSPGTQKKRALMRPNMDEKKLGEILVRQTKIPIAEKVKNSDFVIENEPGHDTLKQVELILEKINAKDSAS